MDMMRTARYATVLTALCLAFGCGTDRDIVPDQRTAIENYLNSKQITDYTIQDGVYRFVPNDDRETYDTDPAAAPGDSVYFMFEEYVFTSSGPGQLCYTNKSAIIGADTVINPQFWPLDPLGVRVGSTGLIAGLTRGLPGCRQGDSVVMLITSDLAYGDHPMGVVQRNKTIMMMLNILEVKK